MSEQYDLVIIGGGTGGYVAAIRASQLGLKTAIVEKKKLGGTCLHSGCIPSKALLRSAEVYVTTKRSAEFGVLANDVSFQFSSVQERKNKIIDQLHRGVIHLMKQGKIDVYQGVGRLAKRPVNASTVENVLVEKNDGSDSITLLCKNIILATGSRPRTLRGLPIDGTYVLTSDEALQLEELPKSVVIVGGGVIGVEWASLLTDFGVEVTIVEFAERLVPTEDHEVSRELTRLFKRKKVKVITNAAVLPETLEITDGISIEADVKGKRQQFQAEKLLVSVGRQANVEGINLEKREIEVANGAIVTNEFYQTKEKHIYAVGDVIGGMQLAHVASHEGILAVEHLAGENPPKMNYSLVPRCIYTSPEIASVGITEKEAKEQGYDVKVGKFSFRANGKALVFGQHDGFVKIVANEKTNDLLGVHMIGPQVTDLISEAGLAQVLAATSWQVAKMIHPHPTLSEVIGEAALAVDGKQIHA